MQQEVSPHLRGKRTSISVCLWRSCLPDPSTYSLLPHGPSPGVAHHCCSTAPMPLSQHLPCAICWYESDTQFLSKLSRLGTALKLTCPLSSQTWYQKHLIRCRLIKQRGKFSSHRRKIKFRSFKTKSNKLSEFFSSRPSVHTFNSSLQRTLGPCRSLLFRHLR